MKDNVLKITVKGKEGIGKTMLEAWIAYKLFGSDPKFVCKEFEGEGQYNVAWEKESFFKIVATFNDPEVTKDFETFFVDWLHDNGITKVVLDEKAPKKKEGELSRMVFKS